MCWNTRATWRKDSPTLRQLVTRVDCRDFWTLVYDDSTHGTLWNPVPSEIFLSSTNVGLANTWACLWASTSSRSHSISPIITLSICLTTRNYSVFCSFPMYSWIVDLSGAFTSRYVFLRSSSKSWYFFPRSEGWRTWCCLYVSARKGHPKLRCVSCALASSQSFLRGQSTHSWKCLQRPLLHALVFFQRLRGEALLTQSDAKFKAVVL